MFFGSFGISDLWKELPVSESSILVAAKLTNPLNKPNKLIQTLLQQQLLLQQLTQNSHLQYQYKPTNYQ